MIFGLHHRTDITLLLATILFIGLLTGCAKNHEPQAASEIVSAESFTRQTSRTTQALIKRIQELALLSSEEKSGVQFAGGILVLEDRPAIAGPRIVFQRGASKEIFLDYREIFSHFPGALLRGVRFLYEGKRVKTLSFVETSLGQFLLVQDQNRSEPKIHEIKDPIDYQLMQDGKVAALLRNDKKIFLRVFPDRSEKHSESNPQRSEKNYPLPHSCLHAAFEESEGPGLLIACTTSRKKEWLWFKDKLLPLIHPSLQHATDMTIAHNTLYGLFPDPVRHEMSAMGKSEIRKYAFQDSPLSWIFLDSSKNPPPLSSREIEGYATELIPTTNGVFVRTRTDFFFHYIYLPAGAKRADQSFRIFRPECSLTLIPFLGEIDSHELRCETPVSIHSRSHFCPSTRKSACKDMPSAMRTSKPNTVPRIPMTHQAESVDGTLIPYSMISPHEKSSTDRLLVHVYGSYGQVLEPSYDPLAALFFQHGGTVAYAHTRGGGYFGTSWHDDGRTRRKGAVVEDLKSVVRKIARENPNSSIIIRGKSAGAWPAVSILGEKDLQLRVLVEMPVLSPLKQIEREDSYYEKEIYEWGDPADPEIQMVYQKFSSKLPRRHKTSSVPTVYIRIAENDERLRAEPIVEWLSSFCSEQFSCIVEHSKKAGHMGAFNFYDEIQSLGMQARYLLQE